MSAPHTGVASLIRLMLVTDDALVAGRDLVALAQAAERGGVTSIQLRLKDRTARELCDAARTIVGAVRIPVLVNDRPDVALAAGAAGVHLGPEDVPVDLARRVLRPGMIVGASVGLTEETSRGRGADYWGVGPWRQTGTKRDAGAALGEAGFRQILALAAGTPCIAIGGITPDDVPRALLAGAVGVAVVSGILGADDVEEATRAYRQSR